MEHPPGWRFTTEWEVDRNRAVDGEGTIVHNTDMIHQTTTCYFSFLVVHFSLVSPPPPPPTSPLSLSLSHSLINTYSRPILTFRLGIHSKSWNESGICPI